MLLSNLLLIDCSSFRIDLYELNALKCEYMTKVFFFKSVNCVIHQSEELLEKIDDFDG